MSKAGCRHLHPRSEGAVGLERSQEHCSHSRRCQHLGLGLRLKPLAESLLSSHLSLFATPPMLPLKAQVCVWGGGGCPAQK